MLPRSNLHFRGKVCCTCKEMQSAEAGSSDEAHKSTL